ILMDARAEPTSLAPFLSIAAHLRASGLRAPEILAQGEGFLLLEDLGPTHMAAWLARHPGEDSLLYGAAVEVLARVQSAPPPGDLVALTPTRAAGMIAPLFEHYAPGTDPRLAADLTGRLRAALERLAPEATVLSLRDYHAENLVWRPEREGTDRLGLLDFQDAVLAPPEYDLASLLRDARRDTDEQLRASMIRRFADLTGRSEARVAAATAALGLQRNLRILGIFARLARERGKPGYLALLPRVWAHVEGDLAHPALHGLDAAVRAAVPPPRDPA
ncbi:MAG TPA: phosphotransferase, partial [Rubellimicrobium sp.]|nr:phosphotransferase [Rubellimicrobium sp.]